MVTVRRTTSVVEAAVVAVTTPEEAAVTVAVGTAAATATAAVAGIEDTAKEFPATGKRQFLPMGPVPFSGGRAIFSLRQFS